MIVHLFNSSLVSGPEQLVLPALAKFNEHFMVVNLREERIEPFREPDPLGAFARSLNLDYGEIRVRRRWDPVAIRELRVLLEHLNPDLVHAHGVKASLYLRQARREGKRCPFRIVSTHHGVNGLPDWKTRLYDWLYRHYVLKFFDRVLSVSSEDYHTLRRSGLGENRLRLHLNGIDAPLMDAAHRFQKARDIRTRWLPDQPHPDNLFLFGVVGRLSQEKDHARLLNVLSHLQRLPCDRDWRCLIFGAGRLENPLHQRAHQLGLEQRVIWMGYRNRVGEELAGLDLLLSFSKAEGLPINVLEAGWAGTPVMCTRVGGILDLIPDESYGNWILPREPAEKTAFRLHACLSGMGRERLQYQARRFQERVRLQFTQDRWLQRLQEIYAELEIEIRETPSVPEFASLRGVLCP